jgi:hypothetical protein
MPSTETPSIEAPSPGEAEVGRAEKSILTRTITDMYNKHAFYR